MHLSKVTLRGYRGLDLSVPLSDPLSLVVGANNAGKSAVVDAIRTVLTPHVDKGGQRYVQTSDFTSSPAGVADTLELDLRIDGIPDHERGRLITLLAPALGPHSGRLVLRATRQESGRVVSRFYGGDYGQNEVEPMAREALQFVYLPPLRDAAGDLRPGPGNRLPALINAFAPPGHDDRDALIRIAEKANEELGQVAALASSAAAIQQRLKGMTGEGAFSYLSSLRFSPADYDRIISTLQALAGVSGAEPLQQSGLGYNNLLYISVLLAAMQSDRDAALSVLLVEEPEAHLHPQLQTLLMRYLEQLTLEKAQVVATTHSPQFAASARVERITVLHRPSLGAATTAHPLAEAELTDRNRKYLHRFLDVTKSALLFARRVILVEGVAEQLLIPAICDHLGLSLADSGVTIVNVDGVSFEAFAMLFTESGLPARCAIISDSDPYLDKDGKQQQLSPTALRLRDLETAQRRTFLAQQTLEWDLAHANHAVPASMLDALSQVHPRKATALRAKAASLTAENFADQLLQDVEQSKGPYAQELANAISLLVDDSFTVPSYLHEALTWIFTESDTLQQ